ncbi:MAG TPA: hemerythrin domain-containing protein [Burkholderiaceae bacterium]|nr:hemerythrin domain-containing protein [Burkholderiaceae bacterium]
MDGQREVGRLLEEEHRANLDLLGRLEHRAVRWPRGAAPASDGELTGLLGRLVRQLQRDTGRHFEFEENELFPRMADAGDGDIAALLREEHEAMRELARELLPLAQSAAAGTLDAEGWQALRRATLEMVERQVAHIQKESMALLPLLDDMLDDETDQRLALDYVAG